MKSVSMKSAGLEASTEMNHSSTRVAKAQRKPGVFDRWARSFVLGVLSQLRTGRIILDDEGKQQCYGEDNPDALTAHIQVLSQEFYTDLVRGGSIGCGESYMHQNWTSNDLITLVRVIVLNLHVLDGVDGERSWFKRLATRTMHRLNANSREGSRRNISAHYDLSNTFFAQFLDSTMMYSAAIFPTDATPLHEASLNKLTHICERLQLKPEDHLLEIGTGWGSLAIHAASRYGCRVTTTTLSQQQFMFAEQRIREAGLQDRIKLLLKDYRDLDGEYDKLVSVEMIEAVGHEYYANYFGKCSSLLKADGLMLIQAITISDQRYEKAKYAVDFIQRYIFPGGCLPSNSVIAHHVSKDTDMQIIGLEDITRDYALTISHWRHNFLDRSREIQALGFTTEFMRMWDYYLAYCQGGFMERVIHTAQILIAKPQFRNTPRIGLPAAQDV
ncbi:MAG: cyclopropane-fatty-acyl-phospholipid synthase family protein [Gammaproteobacteria bacterium]|nr:cyclopropane-fatty-acyl-phospholipid synthase family protein [Gammaproteobacteria bacterium]MDP2141047.1 cyclopropane-fatty-acyl-phospholipid synthase family protein [Gammaproteobacteria bacterium]MDP2348505.1 cyclopropane-fatty-acyl-phospholipid synthase family protein [Gammaproteobacteria bacterium]